MSRSERIAVSRKRLVSVLGRHTVANWRTLEQKICDAGPNPMRVDPHILTPGRDALIREGRIERITRGNTPWFHLNDADPDLVAARLDEQHAITAALQHADRSKRIGQTLEIAVLRALRNHDLLYLGDYPDLDDHDDATLYSKDEPSGHIGRNRIPGNKCLDFLVSHSAAGYAGIEVKNTREWLYPYRDEIKDFLGKCVALDCVPVLIARRFPYVTFHLLNPCGVLLHQVYNQLMPSADADIAEQAKDKRLLGYHDIRVGNQPDKRLMTFIGGHMMATLADARERFDEYKDLLADFASGAMRYDEFSARIRRREGGSNEDYDYDWE